MSNPSESLKREKWDGDDELCHSSALVFRVQCFSWDGVFCWYASRWDLCPESLPALWAKAVKIIWDFFPVDLCRLFCPITAEFCRKLLHGRGVWHASNVHTP